MQSWRSSTICAAQARAADALRRQCAVRASRVAAFDRQWLGRRILDLAPATSWRPPPARRAPTPIGARRRTAAVAGATRGDRARGSRRRTRRAHRLSLDREGAHTHRGAGPADRGSDRAVVSASLRGWVERVDLAGKARLAAWLLLASILLPYAIRALCYFVLAPIAARAPPIRLRVPGGGSGAIPPAERSTTSVGCGSTKGGSCSCGRTICSRVQARRQGDALAARRAPSADQHRRRAGVPDASAWARARSPRSRRCAIRSPK
jgi:hypothetical protein